MGNKSTCFDVDDANVDQVADVRGPTTGDRDLDLVNTTKPDDFSELLEGKSDSVNS